MGATELDLPHRVAVTVEPNLGGHIPALDGIRGLAILMVMFFHMTVLNSTTPVDRALGVAGSVGAYGVDLFFVLSGFLITGILYESKGFAHYFRNFYARRTLRIFPLYYAVVFFSLILLPHLADLHVSERVTSKLDRFGQVKGDELWYWCYLSNFGIIRAGGFRHGILDVSWSLSIEEQFYLVWPLVVFLFNRKALMRICGTLICVAMLFRGAIMLKYAANPGRDIIPLSAILLTPGKVDALAIGAWIALAARRDGVLRLLPLAKLCAIIGAAVFLACFAIGGLAWDGKLHISIGFTALAMFFGSLLIFSIAAAPGSHVFRCFTNPMMTMLGRYSYAMYLFHLPLRAAVRDTIYGPSRFPTLFGSQLPGQLFFYVLCMGLTLLAAMASWHLYEKHFLELKRFFPEGRRH